MNRRTILLAGGTGTMGRILQKHFAHQGWHVLVLTRHPERHADTGVTFLPWDGRTLGAWARELDRTDVVVNLGDYLQPPTRSNGESDEALMACFNRLQGTLDSLNAENDRQLEADLRAIVYKFPGGGADGSKGPNNRRPAA